MKKQLIFILIFILIFSLAGCGECSHTWKEADCLNAALCTRCEEVGEPALGHEFLPATCAAPETCSRCGESRGDALPHSFGHWTIGDTDMFRLCENCDAQERGEINRELYMRQQLEGRWDYYGTKMMGRLMDAYQASWFTYVEYSAEGILDYIMGTTSQELTVEFQHYDPEQNAYYGCMVHKDGDRVPLVLEPGEHCDLLRTNADSEMEVIFYRSHKDHTGLLGTWAVVHGGNLYSFTLNPDYTFTGNLSQPISGQWAMMPDEDSGGSGIGGCLLYYEQDGTMVSAPGFSLVFGTTPGMPEIDDFVQIHLKPNKNTPSLIFSKTDEAQLSALSSALAEAPGKILGTWPSKTNLQWNGTNFIPHIALDYTLTVREDGTFTLALDKQIQGTWRVSTVTINPNGSTSYSYLFDSPTAQSSETVTFHSQSNVLSFAHRDEQGYSNRISFAHLTQEQRESLLQGPTLLPGEYVSEKMVRYDSTIQQDVETPATDYTITIFEDGTYTAMLDEEVTDRWFFYDLHSEGGHVYRFIAGRSEYESRRMDDGTLAFGYDIDGTFYTIHFRKK